MYYDFKTSGSGGSKAYYLGELAHGSTMDVSAKYEDYANLTADNFIVVPKTKTVNAAGYSNKSGYATDEWQVQTTAQATYTEPSVSYNSANGQLSFTSTLYGYSYAQAHDTSGGGGDWNGAQATNTQGLTADVYLLTEVETL